ncbi:hypothetical protein [Streptomyces sp. NPDC017448]|uniref:hypothetical protein n=1 Tax=Streptomyces sp. NPDC017448 TaxID=3364996 RepID=UPI00378CFD70
MVSHLDNVEDWYNESRRIANRSSNTKDLREYVEGLLFEPINENAYHADQETQRGFQHKISRKEFEDVDWDEVHEHVLDEG